MSKLYCKIVNGNVTDQRPLPDSFRTDEGVWITGFNNVSSEEALSHGFYEFVMPNVSYDKDTQDVRYFQNILNPDNKTVSPKYEIVPKPVDVSSNYTQNDFDLIKSLLQTKNIPEKPLKNI
jgi:hypothetical protein